MNGDRVLWRNVPSLLFLVIVIGINLLSFFFSLIFSLSFGFFLHELLEAKLANLLCVTSFFWEEPLHRADHFEPVLFLAENSVEVEWVVVAIHFFDRDLNEFLELLGFMG